MCLLAARPTLRWSAPLIPNAKVNKNLAWQGGRTVSQDSSNHPCEPVELPSH
jgi:hypothetical protein